MPPLQPLPVTQLIKQARLYPAQALPKLTHQSYPIPVRGGRAGIQVLFFYGRGEIIEPRDGLKIWSPEYIAYVNAITGKFEELKAVAQGDFGQKNPADKPIGKYLTLAERLVAEFANKLALWFQAYDAIFPSFASGAYGLTPELQQAARDFARLTPEILEAPLMPYYQAAGREFFEWL